MHVNQAPHFVLSRLIQLDEEAEHASTLADAAEAKVHFPRRKLSGQQTKAMHQVSSASDVRTIIANHLGIDVERVTNEAHFTDDLGADWLDRLELMIVIEDQFPAVEITDDDVDQIEVVGDLIRHIKGAWVVRRDGARPIVEAPLQ
jgi:acyl carrier protein